MSLELINNPIFATLQDKGRFSFTHIGVTNSGVMDEFSYLVANKLLDNKNDGNIIEIAFSNVVFKANTNTHISITGAYCEFFINDTPYDTWRTFNIKVGDIIKIGKIYSGTRVYLSVKNGFKIAKVFGSNSTTIKESLGGINGEKLKKGDIFTCETFNETHTKRFKKKYLPKYNDSLKLRVILSYQEEFFEKEEKEKFFSSIYTVTNDFNKMGCKLDGSEISCKLDGIISEGISYGSIQIPKDGKPIILLKDKQTIGGYPKIGAVLSIDCFKLSQAKVGTKIEFIPFSIEKSQDKVKAFYKQFD